MVNEDIAHEFMVAKEKLENRLHDLDRTIQELLNERSELLKLLGVTENHPPGKKGARPKVPEDAVILNHIAKNPGCDKKDLNVAASAYMTETHLKGRLTRARSAGWIVNRGTRANPKWYLAVPLNELLSESSENSEED